MARSWTLLPALLVMACSDPAAPAGVAKQEQVATRESREPSELGTEADRRALAEDIIAKTMRREAFSPPKNERLGLDVEKAMRERVEDVAAAKADEDLFYGLVRLSNARKDRHLKVAPSEGGLEVPDWGRSQAVPIRFATDFGQDVPTFFVADLAAHDWGETRAPALGDRVVAVNGVPVGEYVAMVTPYFRYSTTAGLHWWLGERMNGRTSQLPPSLYPRVANYTLLGDDGKAYELRLEWQDPDSLKWLGHFDPKYPDFEPVFQVQTFDLFAHTSRKVLLLRWHWFGADLVQNMDRLMAHAEQNGLLDHTVIIDATRAHGGSKGANAIQRLSPKPFKTTFGNLRLSDATRAFIESKRAEKKIGKVDDQGVGETMDRGTRLLEWLENDVTRALEAGDDYSENVPFKLAHLAKDSDGIAHPAKVHFRGPLIVFLSPHGGSHLDQFAAMIVDNDLGHTIGMSSGGYSNTWEWTETLTLPGSGRPLVDFMWSIGHTIRPNGEILEGNPAPVDEPAPLTRENAESYHALLLAHAFAYLDGATSAGLADDTRGAWVYTRRYRRNEDGVCTHPAPDLIDMTFTAASERDLWTYVGDEESELVSFSPGDPAEVSGNPIDNRREKVLSALVRADDFQPVYSTNDGEMNFDAGTGGSVTLQLAGGKVIRPDGRKATGKMPTTASEAATLLDGCEILVFEDAEYSGFRVELAGPTQTVSVAFDDYQNDVVDEGFGDDTMTAIDLDTLSGWRDPYVERIMITDDGVSQGAVGRCAKDEIDTSLELDAVAVRRDVIGSR